MTISIPELSTSLDICWDISGIPHIFAGSIEDAYRGLGYACASERLWQLHLSNLYATGTAASVMGEKFVAQDLMHKSFNVVAGDIPDSPGDYIVDAYLQGVNAYVASLDEVPPEFKKAGTEPRIYTRHDVASRYRFTGWFQHKTWLEKIYLGKLMAEYGVEYFRHNLLRFSDEDAEMIELLKDDLLKIDLNVARLLFPNENLSSGTQLSGSNNWAISADLSASGYPMLATDPHQPHSIPNTFFYSHLSAPGWDAFGASFPGVPYFMMGFNQHVSWGLTTGFVDTCDVFVESSKPENSKTYSVDIAGTKSREFTIAETSHGPVLESLADALGFTNSAQQQSITSVDWVMRDIPTSAGILALMPLASSSAELGDSLFENDVCPLVNNIIAVDRNNESRRYIAATIRQRPGFNKPGVTGMVPLPADNPAFIFPISTAEQLMVESNPGSGYMLTANNDTMGVNGDFPIHNFATHDARARRIEQLLLAHNGKFAMGDFTNMQLDLLDLRAQELLPDILAALKTGPACPELTQAIALLSDWDGVADVGSKAACIFYPLMEKRVHTEFMNTVLGDNILFNTMSTVAPSLNRFAIKDFFYGGSPWNEHRQILEQIICQQVVNIVQYLNAHYGDWRWGQIHQISFGHSLRKYETWQQMQVGPDPIGGSATTLAMAMHNPPKSGTVEQQVYHGPAFRWVVDMADPMHFKFVIAGGNGGRPDSEFISNQYPLWLAGDMINMTLVREELDIVRSDKC